MEDNLDLIEARITALERQILGVDGDENTLDLKASVTDNLLQAQIMITSALRCRDSITGVMDRMARVDESLDPTYVAQMIDVEYKMNYVLEMHEKLKRDYEKLKDLDKLILYLSSDNINTVVQNEDRIELAEVKNSETNRLSLDTVEVVIKVLVGYNDMMKHIKLIFRQMNLILMDIETGEVRSFQREE